MQVPLVKSMQAQDLSTVWKMCTKCGKQILACVRDPECKAALDCLTSCASNDQVCFVERASFLDLHTHFLKLPDSMQLHACLPPVLVKSIHAAA